jgi:hypothetical protein
MTFKITKPAEVTEGMHIILMGKPGTGKTSTLDDPNLKVLLIDFEGGSAVLSEADQVDRIDVIKEAEEQKVHAFTIFEEICAALHKGELIGYDLIAIDSLGRFEDALKEHIVKVVAKNAKRALGEFGNQQLQDYSTLKTHMTRIVKWFHGLTKRGDNSIHVVWLSHVSEVRDELTKQLVDTRVAVSGSQTPEIIMSIVDGFFYMYNREIVEDGKHKGIERGVLTQTTGGYSSKVRQSKKREPLPPKIVNPVWSEIFNQLGYVRK